MLIQEHSNLAPMPHPPLALPVPALPPSSPADTNRHTSVWLLPHGSRPRRGAWLVRAGCGCESFWVQSTRSDHIGCASCESACGLQSLQTSPCCADSPLLAAAPAKSQPMQMVSSPKVPPLWRPSAHQETPAPHQGDGARGCL